jgi:multicomponent Na+:H+ antiporter subunit G
VVAVSWALLVGDGLLVVGTVLVVTAAVGILRLPDIYNRTNAVTKAATLGVAFVLAGAMFHLPAWGSVVTLLLAIAAQLFTTPIAGYAVGRAAYRSGVPLASITHRDDLAGKH